MVSAQASSESCSKLMTLGALRGGGVVRSDAGKWSIDSPLLGRYLRDKGEYEERATGAE